VSELFARSALLRTAGRRRPGQPSLACARAALPRLR
jgi:hypothetical protein